MEKQMWNLIWEKITYLSPFLIFIIIGYLYYIFAYFSKIYILRLWEGVVGVIVILSFLFANSLIIYSIIKFTLKQNKKEKVLILLLIILSLLYFSLPRFSESFAWLHIYPCSIKEFLLGTHGWRAYIERFLIAIFPTIYHYMYFQSFFFTLLIIAQFMILYKLSNSLDIAFFSSLALLFNPILIVLALGTSYSLPAITYILWGIYFILSNNIYLAYICYLVSVFFRIEFSILGFLIVYFSNLLFNRTSLRNVHYRHILFLIGIILVALLPFSYFIYNSKYVEFDKNFWGEKMGLSLSDIFMNFFHKVSDFSDKRIRCFTSLNIFTYSIITSLLTLFILYIILHKKTSYKKCLFNLSKYFILFFLIFLFYHISHKDGFCVYRKYTVLSFPFITITSIYTFPIYSFAILPYSLRTISTLLNIYSTPQKDLEKLIEKDRILYSMLCNLNCNMLKLNREYYYLFLNREFFKSKNLVINPKSKICLAIGKHTKYYVCPDGPSSKKYFVYLEEYNIFDPTYKFNTYFCIIQKYNISKPGLYYIKNGTLRKILLI